MSFNWTEYLSVAEILCGVAVSGPSAGAEAQRRAGVSRAYYAAFATARNRLRDLDKVRIPRKSNPHWFVAAKYENDPDPRRAMIGIELMRLRWDRNNCDYEDDVPDLPKITNRSLVRALQILRDLRSL